MGIHLKEFMNVLIETDGWLLISTIKIKAENWLSLESTNVNIQPFTKFVFNLLAIEYVLDITEVLRWLNVQWFFSFLIDEKVQGQFSAETWKSQNVLIKLQFSQRLISLLVKIGMVSKVLAWLQIFMKSLSQFQTVVLLFDYFAAQSVNSLNFSNNQDFYAFAFYFISVHENSFRILPQINAVEIVFCLRDFSISETTENSDFVESRPYRLWF